jgi:hypothetical protein
MRDRLDLIAERINLSVVNPQVRQDGSQYLLRDLALEIVRGTPQHGQSSEDAVIGNIFWWVKSNIEYRQDPRDFDQYQGAGRTIISGGSDCDDHTILNAALLNSLGFLTGCFCTSPDNQNWHILATVGAHPFNAPQEVIPLDTTQPESFPGWLPPAHMRKFLYRCTFKEGRTVFLRKVQG